MLTPQEQQRQQDEHTQRQRDAERAQIERVKAQAASAGLSKPLDSLNLPYKHRRSKNRVYTVKKKHRTDIQAAEW